MAVGCSHGEYIHPQARADVLAFRKRFKPEIRFHLGDITDTTCFRGGAAGTKDETRDPIFDHNEGIDFLREYEPNRITWGNHDWRLQSLSTHPKAIVAALAGNLWQSFEAEARKLKAKTVPYDIEDGWIFEGGTYWGHGFMYNQQAIRDHAEMCGGPVVMAHLHAPQQVEGRTLRDSPSFCVGGLVDDKKLTYGRLRRASLCHGHGIVYGEMCETEARLWLARSPNGLKIQFPPGV